MHPSKQAEPVEATKSGVEKDVVQDAVRPGGQVGYETEQKHQARQGKVEQGSGRRLEGPHE